VVGKEVRMIQTFKIMGNPIAQGRPKFYRRGNHVGAYDPKKSVDFKQNVAAQIVAQAPVFLSGVPLSVRILFQLPRPKTLPRKVERPFKKPDIDNLIKAIFDACKGIVWSDDSMICELIAGKVYALDEPHVILTVNELTGG
jgi:Holliday junction resolvase RusA-like endonuclease